MSRTRAVRTRPLADLVGPVLGPALAAQGFTGTDIVASWPEIVGERLARSSCPVRVAWPRRRGGQESGVRPEPATLVVRVEGVFALELQHLAPLVLERINAVYGWRCVGRLVLKQGPVAGASPKPIRTAQVSEADARRIGEAVSGLDDEALRRAAEKLGRAIASRTDDPDAPASMALPQS